MTDMQSLMTCTRISNNQLRALRLAFPASAALAATHADGAIVYTDVLETITVASDRFSIDLGDGIGGAGSVAINNDNVNPFDIVLYYGEITAGSPALEKPTVGIIGSANNRIFRGETYAAQFAFGETIDALNPSPNTITGDPTLLYDNFGGTKTWEPGESGYLGVYFTGADDLMHNGWIALTYTSEMGLTVNGFAYETTPGASIVAGATAIPEPASAAALAALLAGSAALLKRRREATA